MIKNALDIIHFRWFLLSNAAFYIVLHGQMLTRSVLAWELTSSEMSLAWINLAFAIPMIVLALPGGALNDRLNRLSLLKLSQAILTVNELIIWVLLLNDSLEYWHLILNCIVGGCIFPVVLPARSATIFNIVGGKLLGSATALSMTVLNVTRVLGPAACGVIVAQYGIGAAYGFAVFLSVAAFVTTLPIPKSLSPAFNNEQNKGVVEDTLEGFRYIRQRKPIMLSITFGFLPIMLLIPMQNLMILFTQQVWPVGEDGLGLLLSVAGIGGTLGSFWVARRGENTRRVKIMFAAMLTYLILTIAFSWQNSFYLALMLLFAANCGAAIASTLNNTSIQLLTDDNQRGRVSSITMVIVGLAPLTVVPMAWMAKHWGIDTSVTVTSGLLLIIAIAMYCGSRTMRTMDSHVEIARSRH